MTAHFDPLSEREPLGKPFLTSLFLHVFMFSFLFAYSWALSSGKLSFGDPNAMQGGSIPINIVKGIPLAPAQTVILNPVANDTRSAVPAPPPEPKAQERVVEPEDAVPLPGPKAKKAAPTPKKKTPERKFRPYVPERDNQLYAQQGMGVNTPSYTGLQPDAFGVGVGSGVGVPLGARYGWYVEALQRRIGEQWQKELMQVDPRIRAARHTIVYFEILRDGSLRSIRVTQSSGIPSVDYAAQRAVVNSNPVPPLPSDLGRNSITIDVWFQLKR